MTLEEYRTQIAELDARIEQLRTEKRKLAHEYQELEAQEQALERVAAMTEPEKAQMIAALGIDSTARMGTLGQE